MKNATTTGSGEREFFPARQITRVAPDIAGLFPDGVLTSCEHRDNWLRTLAPLERQQLGDVCEKRFAEFAAGRCQARQLVGVLTGTASPLMVGDYRQPVWPEGVSGSISHSDEFCAVAVASNKVVPNLGLDVEIDDELDDDVVDIVLTSTEQKALQFFNGNARKLIFSIKESNYKCCYHLVRAFIDFKQCEVTLEMATKSYRSVIVCNDHEGHEMTLYVKGNWMIESGHIFTSAVLA